MRDTGDNDAQRDVRVAFFSFHKALGLSSSCFGFSSPWRRRRVVWWWLAGATLDGVCGSDFFFSSKKDGRCLRCPMSDDKKRGEDVRVSLCSS